MPRSLFVSFEGIDGSGKSTQAHALYHRMTQQGIPAVSVREPGSTPLGEHLRAYLKSEQPLSPMAELFMFEAARAELLDKIILPALKAGTTVIADRYIDSTIAYQGAGRGLDIPSIRQVNNLATGGLTTDLTFFLASEPRKALRRSTDRTNRFETQDLTFYERVTREYSREAAADPHRVHAIDASLKKEQIAEQIWGITSQKMKAIELADSQRDDLTGTNG